LWHYLSIKDKYSIFSSVSISYPYSAVLLWQGQGNVGIVIVVCVLVEYAFIFQINKLSLRTLKINLSWSLM